MAYSKHEIKIDLEKLTVDSRIAIEKALDSSTQIVESEVNKFALNKIHQFKKEKFTNNESDFEQM